MAQGALPFGPAGKEIISTHSASLFVGNCLVYRDWGQTGYGNRIPLDHKNLLSQYGLINAFNAAGDVKITAIEGPSGAQPQRDVMLGRPPLRGLDAMNAILDKAIELRLLVRGPFAVGIEPLHEDDLHFVLETMARHAGALPDETGTSRHVVFRLFEAQNNPEEYDATLRILESLRINGYNVGCELAICYTADEAFTSQYYRKLFETALFKRDQKTSAITRISFKDMTGMANAHPGEVKEGNALNLMQVLLTIAREFEEKYGRKIEIGLHTHDSDFALAANASAAAACSISARTEGEKWPIARAVFDTIPLGNGFADTRSFINMNAANGVGAPLSPEQDALLQQIEAKQCLLQQTYAYAANPNIFSGAALRYARLPGGAVAAAIDGAIKPLAASFMRHGLARTPSEGERMAARAFLDVNRMLAKDFGNASSVTPGALNLTRASMVVISSMLERKFFSRMTVMGLDLKKPFDEHRVLPGLVEDIRDYYDALRDMMNTEVATYFRGRMPFPVEERLLKHICYCYLNKALPPRVEESALNNLLGQPAYERVRPYLLSRPSDKTGAYEILRDAGLNEEDARSFAAHHIGLNEGRRNDRAEPILEKVRSLVDAVEHRGQLAIDKEEAVFAGVIMGGLARGALSNHAVNAMTRPAETHPYLYPDFIDRAGRTRQEIKLISDIAAAMAKYKVSDLTSLAARDASFVGSLYPPVRPQNWMGESSKGGLQTYGSLRPKWLLDALP